MNHTSQKAHSGALIYSWCILDIQKQVLTVEAFLFLSLARLLIRALPFSIIARLLGYVTASSIQAPKIESDRAQCKQVSLVMWSINSVVRYILKGAVCLPQCLAAAMMLRRRGIPYRVCFGVRTNAQERSKERALLAHSWVEVGTEAQLGRGTNNEFTQITSFAYDGR